MHVRMGRSVVAAFVAAGVALPMAASASNPALTLRATVSGYTTVRFPRAITLHMDNWSATGRGRYRVLLLDRVVSDRVNRGFNVLFADLPALGGDRVTLGAAGDGRTTVVPAGLYRLYSVSDAPAQWSIPVTGSAGRDVQIRTATPVQVRLTEGTPTTDPVPPYSVASRSSFRLGRDVVFQVARWRFGGPPGPFRDSVDQCVAASGRDCAGDGGTSTGVRTTVESNSSDSATWARIEDTFDHTFAGPALAVTHFDGTDRPTSYDQLIVAMAVG
jgi:hypothetical protein